MVGKRDLAGIAEQLINRVDRASHDALNEPHRRAFAEKGEDLGALGEGQFVHASYI
jgi:hypothetical protein